MEEHDRPQAPIENPRPNKALGIVSFQLVVAALLCALSFGLKQWYPQAAQTLRPWIIGQEDNRVMQAFSALTETMEQGQSLGEAVQAFYMEITGETKVS